RNNTMKSISIGAVLLLMFLAGNFFRDFTNRQAQNASLTSEKTSAVPTHCANEKLYDNLDDALIEIGNICKLDLSFQHLKVFPIEITKLSHLVELRLDDNEFTSLPPEIGQLKDLQIL